MAKVLLLSAVPENSPAHPYFARHDLERLQRSASKDRFGVHALTEDPSTADLILFVERDHATGPFMEEVRKHPYVRKYREKCFVHNARYRGVLFLPGVHTCVRKRDYFLKERLRSGQYLELFDRKHFDYDINVGDQRPYLFSFVGQVATWPSVRVPIAELNHPRGFFQDTTERRARVEAQNDPEEKEHYQRQYVEICKKSKFILCPRGVAPASMRVFEAMRFGRVPVIIADQWVYPQGPEWEAFSIHVAESDVGAIPHLLEEREEEAEEMGRRARAQWDEWFSEEVAFHRTVEWCLDMKKNRRVPEAVMHYTAYANLLSPLQLRRYARKLIRAFK